MMVFYRSDNMEKKLRGDHEKKYYTELLENAAFWLTHSPDLKYGGFFTCLDRDGSVYGTDKPMWLQGRGIWFFSRLYNDVEPRPEWLEAARNGYRFLCDHGFDSDGRMFFLVTRDGKPLRKRRYLFTETFAVIAMAEYSKASGDTAILERSRKLFNLILEYHRNPGRLEPKVFPESRNMKSHSMPMILLATAQTLRKVSGDNFYNGIIDEMLAELLNHFFHEDYGLILENVGPDGAFIDIPEGRCVNPGHAIETSWFIMEEGSFRRDNALVNRGIEIMKNSLKAGWDEQYGGIFSFIDVKGLPPLQLEWDSKLWWPHTETLYALLLASRLSGNTCFDEEYRKVYQWTYSHFPDLEMGEWFGYLRRDGSILLPVKGSIWKGAFHVPRFLLLSWLLLKDWNRP